MSYLAAFVIGAVAFGTVTGRKVTGAVAKWSAVLAVLALAIVGALALLASR